MTKNCTPSESDCDNPIGIPRTIPPYGDRLLGVFGGGICLTPVGRMIIVLAV